jgi:hypothetical protein
MNATLAPETAPRQAPLALWRVAQAFIETLHVIFGAPEAIAAKHTLARAFYERLASWLRCGEAFVRRLIAIEAAAYVVAAADEEPTPRRKAALRQRKLVGFDADQPAQWRVSFRCLLSPGSPRIIPHHVETKTRAPKRDPRFRSAWPLAERYEALLRAYNDPAPYARRLARTLYVSPHRVHAILRAPDEAPHRIDRFDDAGVLCERTWPPPHRSSG